MSDHTGGAGDQNWNHQTDGPENVAKPSLYMAPQVKIEAAPGSIVRTSPEPGLVNRSSSQGECQLDPTKQDIPSSSHLSATYTTGIHALSSQCNYIPSLTPTIPPNSYRRPRFTRPCPTSHPTRQNCTATTKLHSTCLPTPTPTRATEPPIRQQRTCNNPLQQQ